MARATSGSLSHLSTAVWAAALTMICGATARTVAASDSGFEKSAVSGPGLSKSSATTSPSTAQRALQFPADLAVLAEQQDLHGLLRARRTASSTQSR